MIASRNFGKYFFVLFSISLIAFLPKSYAATSCQKILSKNTTEVVLRSSSFFLKRVDAQKAKSQEREPKFLDPQVEKSLVPLWSGTRNAPNAVLEALHPKVALLDFQLLAADAGSVKSSEGGQFTSLRLNHEWNGYNMSTNLGLPIDAMILAGLENKSKLVPSEAKAVFMFMHGGGTKTTGHHVAASFSNHLLKNGVVVLSVDAPYHAYGPREDISPAEYYKYIKDFRNEFIPENVPVFFGGHSMGGVHADNMMRLSDQADLGLQEAFKGFINLSGPMDAAPGESFAKKEEAEERIRNNEKLMSLVPEEERDLTVSLLEAGKSSALGGVSAETFMSVLNWNEVPHNGRNYVPTLVVMGEADALYVGQDKIFEKHLASLENTETHILGARRAFGADAGAPRQLTAHMIFDHYRDGTDKPETVLLVREFIEKILGEKLPEKGQLLDGARNATTHTLAKLLKLYVDNLAFRDFAHSYKYLSVKSSDEVSAMTERKDSLNKTAREAQKEASKIAKQDPEEAKRLRESVKPEQEEAQELMLKLRHEYIPEDSNLTAFAKANVERRLEIVSENKAIGQDMKGKNAKLKDLRARKMSLRKKNDAMLKAAVDNEAHSNPELAESQRLLFEAHKNMVDLQIQMNEVNSAMVRESAERGDYAIKPSPEKIALYSKLDEAYADYNMKLSATKALVKKLVRQGEFDEAFTKVYTTLYGQDGESGIHREIKDLEAEVSELEAKYSLLEREHNDLLKDYIDQVSPNLFSYEETSVAQELARPLDELMESAGGSLQKLKGIWDQLWKERSAEEGTSLY